MRYSATASEFPTQFIHQPFTPNMSWTIGRASSEIGQTAHELKSELFALASGITTENYDYEYTRNQAAYCTIYR